MTCRICGTDTENGWDGEPIDICPECSKKALLKKAEHTKSEKSGSKYTVAQGVLGVSELLGWLVVIGGGTVAIASFLSRNGFFLMSGIGMAVAGLLLVTYAQVARVTVDNANSTREILELLKRNLSPGSK